MLDDYCDFVKEKSSFLYKFFAMLCDFLLYFFAVYFTAKTTKVSQRKRKA
jgi:hypothetical protein